MILVTPGLTLVVIYLLIMFLIAQIKENRAYANFAWGGGVVLLALYSLWASGNYHARPVLVTFLTCLWGFRLASFLILRQTRMEDPRYKDWTTSWDLKETLKTFFWVFGAQLFGIAVMSLPIVLINVYSGPGINLLDLFALTVWVFGFWCESTADYQLYTFRKYPERYEGNIYRKGLWKYSRHPNYFGELLMWIAMYLFALSVPHGGYAIAAPLLAFAVFWFYSIPKVESVLKQHPEFEEYRRATSPFILWTER